MAGNLTESYPTTMSIAAETLGNDLNESVTEEQLAADENNEHIVAAAHINDEYMYITHEQPADQGNNVQMSWSTQRPDVNVFHESGAFNEMPLCADMPKLTSNDEPLQETHTRSQQGADNTSSDAGESRFDAKFDKNRDILTIYLPYPWWSTNEFAAYVIELPDPALVKFFELLQWLIVIFALWSSTLTVRRRYNDVLHRRCFVCLLLIRACIEQNPGPDTTGRVYEIKLDDASMREQLRDMTPETLKGIFSFMEKITQRRCISYTTLHLYVWSQSENDLRLYMILSEKNWPEINSDNDHSCTPPEFLAYCGPNQTDILICHKTSENSRGFDLLSKCISKTSSESISYTGRSDDCLYQQNIASIRVPLKVQYNNGLFEENPRCSAIESKPRHLDAWDVVWITHHYVSYPECKYAGNMGLWDGCLQMIYITTEVPWASVSTLSDSLMRAAVDDQTFENVTDDMGFPMELVRRAVQLLANKCNHLPNVYDIVSAIEEINNCDSPDA